LKFVVVVYYCSRLKIFNERMDGMVYGAVASLGFAAMENVLYVTLGDLTLAMTRALTAVPCHAFLGAIMGYYVGQARFDSRNRTRLLATGLLLVILLHGLYDFPLLTLKELKLDPGNLSVHEIIIVMGLSSLTLGVLMFEGYLAIHLIRRLRATQLHVKVRLDAIAREKL
jgi:RsiW-degrading membrane proteinase PrsW (M82 family)